MTYADDILPAIMEILEAVAGIGKTYNFPQHSAFIETHKELFVTSDNKFHVWWPNRIGWEATGGLSVQVFRTHIIELTGYYALSNSDSSDEVFQGIIDAVADAFDAKATFNLDGTVDQHLPAQMEKSEIMFGGFLCHKAIIRIFAEAEATEGVA